jgi:hypothetical protein
MPCFFCEGPAHPATGSQLSSKVIACGVCTRRFWAWFRAQQHKTFGGYRFYDYVRAATVRAPVLPDTEDVCGSTPQPHTK